MAKEFWIVGESEIFDRLNDALERKKTLEAYEHCYFCHLIEYSAYEKLLIANNKLKQGLQYKPPKGMTLANWNEMHLIEAEAITPSTKTT